jgi:hypothetical protein
MSESRGTGGGARKISHTGVVGAIAREYIALPGGTIRQVYSVERSDGTVALADYQAWLSSRAARCACGKVCLGSGRTCGEPECVRRLNGA